MSLENGNKIVGGIILIGILVIILCLIGVFKTFNRDQYLASGLFMLAASLPITAAFNGIFGKSRK